MNFFACIKGNIITRKEYSYGAVYHYHGIDIHHQ